MPLTIDHAVPSQWIAIDGRIGLVDD